MQKVFLIILGWLLLGCQVKSREERQEKNIRQEAIKIYFGIIQNLSPEFPGRGIDVYNDIQEDRAMAYGLILSAEANRFLVDGDTTALRRVRTCGNWLLANPDRNKNGIMGYGLADAWDAFGDSTINPVHQEYTITTAVVVKALFDWYECDPEARQKEILPVALASLKPYLNNTYDSPAGIPAYSLSVHDRKYDVFNPAAYLAGQLQRMARIMPPDSVVDLLQHKSRKIIAVMQENKLTDENQNIFWNYGLIQKRPNDLIHMAYIIEGLRDFKNYGGVLNLDWNRIVGHVKLFKSGNTWYERVGQEHHNREENVRVWALGLLLYTLAREEQFSEIEATLLPQLALYQKTDGHFKFKENDGRSMIRQEAHVLFGLSYYLFR